MRRRFVNTLVGASFALGALLAGAEGAQAQTTTGTVRGYVRGAGGTPVDAATISARHLELGQERQTATNEAGFYNLAGLRPGPYDVSVRRIGLAPQTRRVIVQIGQTLTVDFNVTEATTTLAAVVVTETPAETQTSEVATNITEAQIEDLPTASRNVLELAALAPGVRVDPDRIEGTSRKFAAGAQSADQVNLFIDGSSYKNEIITGGIAGQDASRGNPFPKSALQEFRIITNNFKAEYQKASSAVITAVTKSGTNAWEGSAFFQFQNKGFVARDTFQRANANFRRPEYERYLAGVSVGGPIQRDRMFFFGSYEANFQDREGVTRFFNIGTAPQPILDLEGDTHVSPFRQHNFFGKLTYNPSQTQAYEFSADWRHETDTRGFGNIFACQCTAFSHAEDMKIDVGSARLRHQFFGGLGTNEAVAGFHTFIWNPTGINTTTPSQEFEGHGRIGGRDASQDLSQRRFTLRDDFTFSPIQMSGTHVPKIGASLDFSHYNMTKFLNDNPLFFFRNTEDFQRPYRALIGIGDPTVEHDNTQFGVYAQDDWSPTPRLTVNAGLRWDVETGMVNRDYVTPSAVRDTLTKYQDSLFIDVDLNDYFTDGNDRDLFLGAIQPRLGLSYDLTGSGRTSLFASWGIFYDRLTFNASLDESYQLQHPIYEIQFGDVANGDTVAWDPSLFSREGLVNLVEANGRLQNPEAFLLPNDVKPPHSNQWSVGLRHDFGSWNAGLTYTQSRSKNGFTFEWANLDYQPGTINCCQGRTIPGFRNVLIGNNNIRTWYDAVFIQVDRPYRLSTRRWGWGAGLAWTISDAEMEGNDIFSFPNVASGNPRRDVPDHEKHRIVGNWVTDLPYIWGIQFSGILSLGSGRPFFKNANTPSGTVRLGQEYPDKQDFLLINNAFAYRTLDLRFKKDLPNFAGNRLGITAEVFNVFNWDNFGCFDETFVNNDVPNANFGRPNCVIADPRRLQLGVQYDFSPSVTGIGGR